MIQQGHIRVNPVIESSVRGLCCKPYPNHPKGCPNYKKKKDCPPQAPILWDILDQNARIVMIWNQFAIGEHVDRMRQAHPDWSERQLYCCLYWQPKARKELKTYLRHLIRKDWMPPKIIKCPEACGVNITATMRNIGIVLEWPPKKVAYQVVLAGWPTKPIKRERMINDDH